MFSLISRRKKITIGLLFVLGTILLVGSSVTIGFLPEIIKDKIDREMRIISGTDSFERWEETKVPVTNKFYFFHLNNSETYTSLDDIELVERGPYVYKSKRFKENISIIDDLLSFRQAKYFSFRQEDNILDENDELNFLNFPILSVIQNKLIEIGPTIFESVYAIDPMPNETSLFIKRPVVDMLFNGIKVHLLESIADFGIIKIPERFSILEPKPGTKVVLEKEMTINSGWKHINKLGQLSRFDNKSSLTNEKNGLVSENIWPYYNTPDINCNELKGTDGSYFAPDISKHDTLYVFQPEICRTVYFKYIKETEVKDINTYRFRIPAEYYHGLKKNPENSCYCLEQDKNMCNRDGVLDISNCFRKTFGSSVAMSAPYFYHGDSSFRTQFKYKLEPNKPLNEKNFGTYIDIEPYTGISLNVVKRIQMNFIVRREDIITMPKLKESSKDKYIIPVFWFEQSARVDDHHADELRKKVLNNILYGYAALINGAVLGTIMIALSIYLLWRNI